MSKPIRATLLLLLAALAACGSSSSASSASSGSGGSVATNPCSLLTAAQAEAVLQDGALTPKPDTTVAPTCSWLPASGSNGTIDLSSVIVIIQDPSVFAGIAKQSGTTVQGLSISKAEGIGDEAYFETTGAAAGTTLLLFKKGSHYIQVSVHKENLTIAQVEDAETTLAQQMVGKL